MLTSPETGPSRFRRVARSFARPPVAFAALFGMITLAGAGGIFVQRSLALPSSGSELAGASVDELTSEQFSATALRPITPETAKSVNDGIPVSDVAVSAASPFRASFAAAVERGKSVDCLASAIYYEAATEGEAGQRAVAQVVLNRVAHTAYPNTVCGVVYQGSERSTGCQFTFTCDGSLARRPSTGGWARAKRIADESLAGSVYAAVGRSTHYHANYVVPYWSSSLLKTATIGAHIFYRSAGLAGAASAFTARYAGVEPTIARRAVDTDIAENIGQAADTFALPSMPKADVPEEQAEKLDRFALLDYKVKPARENAAALRVEPLEKTLGAALDASAGKAKKAAGPIVIAAAQ